ncbi:hypothetical protein FRC04_009190 [Tulasnella sp. 424]|nr:hypothetical protein FRC04_009190 [Tulasnella sp. 424]
MLRSYGASPEIIMAAAAELSQSNASTDSASSANLPASTTLTPTASPSATPTSTTPAPTPAVLEPMATTTTATPTASALAEPASIVQAANLASDRLVIQHHRPPIMPTNMEARPTPLSSGSAGCQTMPSTTMSTSTSLPFPSAIPAISAPQTEVTTSNTLQLESATQPLREVPTQPIPCGTHLTAVQNYDSWAQPSPSALMAAAEYFSTGPVTSVATARPSMHGLTQMAASSAFTFGQSQHSPTFPRPGQASPFDLPHQRSSQWGATGLATSHVPHVPSALPRTIASALPAVFASPQKAVGTGPLISSTTLPPKSKGRKSSASVSVGPPKKVMAPKTVYLVPRSNAQKLDASIKAGCDLAGLSANPVLWTSMTSAEVKAALEAPFMGIIDFVTHSYRFFYINRDLGNALCPIKFKTPSDGNELYSAPDGNQIYSAYSRRTLIILRLNFDVVVPQFEEGIRLWGEENPRRKKGRQVLDEESDAEEEDDFFVCPSCNGTFALEKLAAHETRCPARHKPSGSRKVSGSKRTHSRHHSVPAVLSPERKRPRYEGPTEPSSDGEVDARSVHRKRKGVLRVDEGLEDEEEDEIIDDPEANDPEEAEGEEDTGKARPSGTRIQSSASPLCAFCDGPLLSDIDPKYWELQSILASEASPQPTPKNPKHLELPAWRAFEACRFHQETRQQEIKRGVTAGYPAAIDFATISSRLDAKLTTLTAAFYHPHLHSSLEAFRYGARRLKSADERLAAMGEVHSGYYGPKGLSVIVDFLMKKFPPHSFTPSSVLSSSDFLFFLLAPYASFLLISEDMPSLSPGEVWEVWEKSKAYGAARFADDS